MFVGVAYRPKLRELGVKFFRNPIEGDSTAFAQVMVFSQWPFLRWYRTYTGGSTPTVDSGSVPGSLAGPPGGGGGGKDGTWAEEVPASWNLQVQYWSAKLVPATTASLPAVLQADPMAWNLDPGPSWEIEVQKLGNLSLEDMRKIGTH